MLIFQQIKLMNQRNKMSKSKIRMSQMRTYTSKMDKKMKTKKNNPQPRYLMMGQMTYKLYIETHQFRKITTKI